MNGIAFMLKTATMTINPDMHVTMIIFNDKPLENIAMFKRIYLIYCILLINTILGNNNSAVSF